MIALRFHPKLLDTLKGYDRATLGRDVSAAITVGVLALPLGIAFAIASSASPAAGIWTAISAGFIVSAFAGSRVQIGGLTGAFIPILYAIIAHNMLAATLIAGVADAQGGHMSSLADAMIRVKEILNESE